LKGAVPTASIPKAESDVSTVRIAEVRVAAPIEPSANRNPKGRTGELAEPESWLNRRAG
jgi:hypothetical protein